VASTQLPSVDYGLDSPTVVRNLAGVGLILGIFGAYVGPGPYRWIAVTMGASYLAGAGLMVLSSRYGKVRMREALFDQIQIAPDAIVLDVGCGHGLLLVGAAMRAPHGASVGIDLWSSVDQKDDARAAALANAAAEGVADRVEVHDADMREIPFADASFDVVVSSLAIHNLKEREGRRKAIEEIVRVLKPGGRVGVVDIVRVGQYAEDLRASGMRDVRIVGVSPWIFPPARMLTATK
jgi:arsenite methyltransferase